jgi:hypothetical protein
VTSAEVSSTKVTAAVSAAAVSTTSMAASTTGKGGCRDYRTAQKDTGNGYKQCFSQHQDSPSNSVSSNKPYRRIFFRHRRDVQDKARRRHVTACTMRKFESERFKRN